MHACISQIVVCWSLPWVLGTSNGENKAQEACALVEGDRGKKSDKQTYISINGKCYGKMKRLEMLERGTNDSARVEFYLFIL